MKSKKLILITILIVGIGIASWNFGFFSPYNYLTAQADIAKNKLQIVFVGESMLTPKDINNVSKKYGFEVIGFGCLVNNSEKNGIDIYNSQMNNHLNELNEVGWETEYKKEIDSLMKLTNIPRTAFWIGNKGNGLWYNVDFLHGHKNNARISIFDKFGELVTKGHFIIVCPLDEIEFMDDLENQIDFYDGENIQLKSNCYLFKRK